VLGRSSSNSSHCAGSERHSHRQGRVGIPYESVANFLANFQVVYLGALIILFLIAEPEGLPLVGRMSSVISTVALCILKQWLSLTEETL